MISSADEGIAVERAREEGQFHGSRVKNSRF
jgi:hypothetical protein